MGATLPDSTDICQYGHQLVPGSDPIVIKTFDEAGRKVREETFLLRRHACMGPGGIYGGGHRMTELDQHGKISREWVEGADPQDHGIVPTKPDKLIAYPCGHGVPESEMDPEDLPHAMFKGGSYGRAHWLIYDTVFVGKLPVPRARCPVCLGQPAPDWRA